MEFYEVLDQVVALVQQRSRVTYRTLKREFQLDDERLEDLKEELLYAYPEVMEDEGRGLIWKGDRGKSLPDLPPTQQHHSPVNYTPPHLAERIRTEQAALEARGAMDGERKTITALFADLKGSTALIEGLDPEEARAIIDPALQLMMDAVHRYEGYVAQVLGDGIFALFGAPIAHEDHPQRALYAALRMQEEMRRYSDQLRLKGRTPLSMRVGVNTGEVVVRSIRKDDLHTDYVPVGHSTNLAARMEQMATPGSILITEYTKRLTERFFELKALGAAEIKGLAEPLAVYEVVGAGPLRTKLQVAVHRGLTRFVGRHRELEQLQHALTQAKAGHGQIVGVMGEPGLGKSRLFYEFQLLSRSGCLVLEAYSVSYGKASPYLPLIELLKSYFQIQLQDDERTRCERVIGKVLGLDRSLEDALPYLFSLLGIEDSTSSLQQMDPQIRRRRTFEALKRLFLRESLNQPLVLIFEDLHWIDSETQGFLDVLSESVASAQLLLLTNYRPEYRHEWGQKTYYTQLRLTPFGEKEAREFLTVLLGTEARLHSLKQVILQKTEGTPFFMEEVVQELFERGVLVRTGVGTDPEPALSLPKGVGLGRSGVHTDALLQIPSTVQGVLAARIDRLAPDEKSLLQQLSVIGREFPLGLARQVVTQPTEELYRGLSSLQHKEFLYEQPALPEPEYVFKHALTQEVAYGTVLHERRKALHERTAQAIEALYPSRLEEHYSEIAHHYSRSGIARKAVEYLQLAGRQAGQRWAYEDAIHHLSTALDLLMGLPDTSECVQQEITLLMTLGPALMATKGLAAPEVKSTYARARTLCQQAGETPQLFSALRGLWEVHHVGADLQMAQALAEQLLRIARNIGDSAFLLEAHSALGMTLMPLGELAPALTHAEHLLALYDPQQHRAHAFLYGGYDPRVNCLGWMALILWLLGYPDRALKQMDEAFTLARELSHPNSLAFTECFAAHVHQFRREGLLTQERAEAARTFATEYGFPLAWGTLLQGWALADQGRGQEGLALMHQDLDNFLATGARLERTYYLALIAEVYGKVDQKEDGLRALTEAFGVVDATGERWCEAELYRLKGELTLQKEFNVQDSPFKVANPPLLSPNTQHLTPNIQAEAEGCFLKAIEIARRQQAKSLELRAVMSVSRLWQQQGKKDKAHKLLSEIYSWFTEGFDTKDLQEAKGLLDALSSKS